MTEDEIEDQVETVMGTLYDCAAYDSKLPRSVTIDLLRAVALRCRQEADALQEEDER